MANTTSANLKLTVQATGENSGTWGQITNTNLLILEQAIGGYDAVALNATTGATLTFSNGALSNGKNQVLKLTGTITANVDVIVPDSIEKTYIVENATSGAFTVTVKTTSGTGVTWAATDKGKKMVYSDGTNVVDTAFTEVVSDVSPSLGGDLDLNSNDITGTGNINITGTIESSGNITGTLATAAQPNITSVGTLTSFTSTGIDDNATSTAITIDSNNNVAFLDGTGSLPSITNSGDENTGIYFPSADTLGFSIGGSEKMRLNATGLGIGTSSISRDLVIKQSAGDAGFRMETASYTNDVLTLRNTNGRLDFGALAMTILTNGNVGIGTTSPDARLHIEATNASMLLSNSGRSQYFRIQNNETDDALVFNANDTSERMRIDSSGNLIVGGTSSSINNVGAKMTVSGGFQATKSSSAPLGLNRISTDGDIAEFRHIGTVVGSISVTSTATSYNTTSDKRLKDNIQTITDGTEKVMAINAVTHTWKNKPDTKPVHGFIAQEMQQIIPEAVNGNPDSEEMMSMDYGRITPLLVASLQDAHKKIKQLENKINNMENK